MEVDQQREQERPQRRQNEAVSVRPKQTLPWRQAQQARINQQREEAWHDDLEQLEARKQARQELETQLEEMRRLLQLVEREQEWGVQEGQAQNQEQKQQQLLRLQGQVKKMEQRLQGLRMIELQEQQDIHQEAVTARYTQNRNLVNRGWKQTHPMNSTVPPLATMLVTRNDVQLCRHCGGLIREAHSRIGHIRLGLLSMCLGSCMSQLERECRECGALAD